MKLKNKKTGEEPKDRYWCISQWGDIVKRRKLIPIHDEDKEAEHKEIGNYFETEEEAELAVRKLKAWKRLKDKGFRFTLTPGVGSLDISPGKFQIEINADMPVEWFNCDAVQEDLNDCFGGEE